MLPIGDDDSARRTVPLVTYALIALNVLIFSVELAATLLLGSGLSFRAASVPIPSVIFRRAR